MKLHAATVITQAGRVVGVQFDPVKTPGRKKPAGRLTAGPEQQAHRTELELPADLKTPEDVVRFHAAVEQKIRVLSAPARTGARSPTGSTRATRKRRP